MKIAIVTGGTKGIGYQVVKDLLLHDYFVYTNFSKDFSGAGKAKLSLSSISKNFEIINANQANQKEFSNFISYIKAKESHIDCIVCNTGATLRKKYLEIMDEEWEKIMQINLNSHFYLLRDIHPLIPNNSRIIFISSMMGILPHGTSLAYGVTKTAIIGLSKNLVKEYEGTGTTVNVIAPGFVETEWQKNKPPEIRQNIYNNTAIKRFATAEEISKGVMFCIDNAFVNGAVLEISGGYCFK